MSELEFLGKSICVHTYVCVRSPSVCACMQVACALIHTIRTLNQKHRIERDENTKEKGNLTIYHASNIKTKINLS